MKSIKKEPDPTQKKIYPCLRKFSDEDFIVLFTSPEAGMVVWSETRSHPVGMHYDGTENAWNNAFGVYWKDFDGEITLSNQND